MKKMMRKWTCILALAGLPLSASQAQEGADLSLSKTASPADPRPGTQITYSIALVNEGPGDALAITVSDDLPAGTTFVSCAATGGGVCLGLGNSRTITFVSLAAGASASITFVAEVDPATTAGTVLTNTASVNASTPDPDPTDNASSTSVTVPSADLSVGKTASPADPRPGTQITYSIAVSNDGPDEAQSVTILDDLPAGTSFVSCSATGSGVCGGAGNSRTISFTSLAAGTSASITLVAQVDAGTTPGTVLVNTASVSTLTPDPDAANNTSSASVTVAAPPSSDLSVGKTASPTNPQAGANVTYTIAVSNAGPDDAQSVTLTDTLPAGTSFVSCSATGSGVCGGAGNSRTISFTSLAAGASASITLVAEVDAARRRARCSSTPPG